MFVLCGKQNDDDYSPAIPTQEIFIYKSWNQWMCYLQRKKILYTWDYIKEILMWWLPWIIWVSQCNPEDPTRRGRHAHGSSDWSDAAKGTKPPETGRGQEWILATSLQKETLLLTLDFSPVKLTVDLSVFPNCKRTYLHHISHQIWGKLLQQ